MAHISVHVGQGRLEGQQQPRAIICEATFSISGTLDTPGMLGVRGVKRVPLAFYEAQWLESSLV